MATTKSKTVIKAHRGMAHVPRGRRRPIGTPQLPRNPRRRPPMRPPSIGFPRRRPPNLQVEPRRLGDDRPRGGQQMTPAMRRRLMEMRRRAQQRRQLPPLQGRQPTATDVAQLKAARDRFNKQMREANKRMRANVFGRRRRKPTQATQTQRVAQAQPVPTPRRRPTPLVPQAQPVPIPATMVVKGGSITKKRIGANDFRKGGYVLSTVDNRKNKK